MERFTLVDGRRFAWLNLSTPFAKLRRVQLETGCDQLHDQRVLCDRHGLEPVAESLVRICANRRFREPNHLQQRWLDVDAGIYRRGRRTREMDGDLFYGGGE